MKDRIRNRKSSKEFSRPNYKDERRFARFKLIIRNILLALLAIGIIAFIGYLTFFSPIFSIQHVIIEGNNKTSSVTLKKYFNSLLHQRIFLASIDNKKVESEFPLISSVSLSKQYPQTVIIKISEYPPFALVQTDQKTYVIVKTGVIVNEVSNSSTQYSLPLVVSSQVDKSKIPFADIANAVSIFETDKKSFITGFKYIYPFDLQITYANNYNVLIRLDKSISEQMKEIKQVEQSVDASKCRNIDVRFSNVYCS